MPEERPSRRDNSGSAARAGGEKPRRTGQGVKRTDNAGRGRFDRQGGPRPDRRNDTRPANTGDSRHRVERPEEPELPEDVKAESLDPIIRRDLMTLDRNNAERVARHLVMAGTLVDEDPVLALEHARAAQRRAGRIGVVREAAGIAAYHAGEWAEALSELRAARRMGAGRGLLAVLADCERGLGRPERAIELSRSDEAQTLTGEEAAELRMVAAGARMDLGQFDQAVVSLQHADLDPGRSGLAAARYFYAYADALVAAGRKEDALKWFLNASAADTDGDTDAEDRAAELGGDIE
ncbi:hypothetical protein [Smaragdicoccus niigatensis]|uniref:hypothetical protein n=1 Tax=Smaragdicoccus niigatensis TaxID=359359 RepID=UPI000374AF57|nr:hypothetical protein [Smaragdicoccus niigatensis]